MTYRFPTNGINTIYLMMGFRCNFQCRHCIQSMQNAAETIANPKDISQATIDYIWHLINIRPAEFGKIKLMFWGGEPLLYFDVIKKAIKTFGEKLNYALVTNGSLLAEEHVKYFNKHNVHVALSYDGPKTKRIRGVNILENEIILNLVKKIQNKSICAVVSTYNFDFVKLFNDVEEKLGDVPINLEQLRVTWAIPENLYNIDLKAYDTALQKIADKALCDIWDGNMSHEVAVFIPYLKLLCRKEHAPLNCGQMYNVMNIDLQGNVYSCHNLCNPIGTVKDERFVLLQRQDEWVKQHQPKKCSVCEYAILCHGGCPNEIINADGEYITCKINKVFFEKVFWLVKNLEAKFLEVDLRE